MMPHPSTLRDPEPEDTGNVETSITVEDFAFMPGIVGTIELLVRGVVLPKDEPGSQPDLVTDATCWEVTGTWMVAKDECGGQADLSSEVEAVILAKAMEDKAAFYERVVEKYGGWSAVKAALRRDRNTRHTGATAMKTLNREPETRDWSQPSVINDAHAAFPANVSSLMPKYDDIPKEFKDSYGRNKWVDMASSWFFTGLDKRRLVPKKDVDMNSALRHLGAIQGSWAPKHEHKEAAVAYLASLWFADFLPPAPSSKKRK